MGSQRLKGVLRKSSRIVRHSGDNSWDVDINTFWKRENVMSKAAKVILMLEDDRIPIFAMHNDTDKWAVIVDNHMGLYDTQEQASRVFNSAGGEDGPESDELAETPFSSSQIIPPHYECKKCHHDEHGYVSEYAADNKSLEKYIKDKWDEWKRPLSSDDMKDGDYFVTRLFGKLPSDK